MKRILTMASTLVFSALIIFLINILIVNSENAKSGYKGGDKVLNIYNWGDYIDPELLEKFTKETSIKINYETFDSNESMYTKVKQGGNSYDIIVPSEYMIEKMRKENLLIPIDDKKIPNLKYYGNQFLNKSFDPKNKYSVPYFWGTLGIVYNDKYIKQGEIKHWSDLWDSKYKKSLLLVDSARDDLGFSLVSMGQSVNTKDLGTLQAAKAKLDTLMPNIKAILNDEIKMYMAQNEAKAAVVWSGDAADMMWQNEHLHYVLPTEGGNLWFDNLAIPKTAKHVDAANEFINFMSDPKNAAQNAEYVGYATPNTAAKKLLPKKVSGDKQFYPSDSVISKLEVYQDLGKVWTQRYNDLFLEFKMTNK